MKTRIVLATALLGLSSLTYYSCKKDKSEDSGTGYMQVQMTDAPGDYSHVYVDVRSAQVHRSDDDDENGWVTLHTRAGIYDLLKLQNNITAILCDSTELPAGKVTQFRMILGTENSVVLTDSSVFPLTIPSSQNTGIKINLNTNIEQNRITRVVLDFDAAESINITGNGTYKMSPVIKVKSIQVQ